MKNNIQQMADHLEFLGYKVEKHEAQNKDEKTWCACLNEKDYNVVLLEASANAVMVKVTWNIDKKMSHSMVGFTNEANRITDVAKFYCDAADGNVKYRVEAIYFGEYNKVPFGEFFDAFRKDIMRSWRIPDSDEIWS